MRHEDMDVVEDLLETAREDPSHVDWADVEPYLAHENNDVRARGAETAAELVDAEPEVALRNNSQLLDLAADDYIAVRQQALAALAAVVPEYTDEFTDDIETFIDALTAQVGTIRVLAAQSYSAIASEHPGALAAHTDAIATVVAEAHDADIFEAAGDVFDMSERETLRTHNREEQQKYSVTKEVAVNSLVEIARKQPDAVSEHVDVALEATTASNPLVAGAAIDVISELAKQGYAVPEAAPTVIEEQLATESVFVQARAVRALGNLGAIDAADSIADLATDATDEDLQVLAEETAEWLQERADSAPAST
ncbi:hypothetical protein Hrd1104_02230 [Halorhabdus sp. CBA1104]|uniref:hypothetical protein n=1 Tax=Halorhabdus sp. CBA1104 TaxID=1380432 RepID=UPI0012B3AC16|nr:hypothetical protein [Halorhabdus sp. CBA1104]QGN06223.1 hypothetical protein Hrd1104_02230 [Halorhabdus sp. CBA1104]